jgi:hypothetical protein
MIDITKIENLHWEIIKDQFKYTAFPKQQLTITFITGESIYRTFKNGHKLSQFIRRIKLQMPDKNYGTGDIPKEYWSQVIRRLS